MSELKDTQKIKVVKHYFEVVLSFWGPNGLLFGLGNGSKTAYGTTHVVEQLLFSMCPSILTFDFDIIFGVIF